MTCANIDEPHTDHFRALTHHFDRTFPLFMVPTKLRSQDADKNPTQMPLPRIEPDEDGIHAMMMALSMKKATVCYHSDTPVSPRAMFAQDDQKSSIFILSLLGNSDKNFRFS